MVILAEWSGRHFESTSMGCNVVIRGISLKAGFRGRKTGHKINHKPYKDFEWQPSGKIVFRLDGRLKAEWQDLKNRVLEDQIPKILAKMELVAKQEEQYQEKTQNLLVYPDITVLKKILVAGFVLLYLAVSVYI